MSVLAEQLTATGLLTRGRWEVDPQRSTVGFCVRHFGVATVEGRFSRFSGSIEGPRATGQVEVGSVQTDNPIRDERLRSPEYFDAERFPRMVFELGGPLDAELRGRLTIRDTSRPVALDLELDGRKDHTVTLRAHGTVSRRAFGLDWGALRQANRLIVSDSVHLWLDLTLVSA